MYLLFFSPSVPLPDFYAVFVFSNDTVTLNFKVAREEFTRGRGARRRQEEEEESAFNLLLMYWHSLIIPFSNELDRVFLLKIYFDPEFTQ